MLLVAGFPVFVIFFFGVFAYFLLRMFSSGSRSETREIFEFYLTSNEMLRDDERRWYGFEINEAIKRGEEIVGRMNPAPPLVYFSLGALYDKAGNHKAAITNLTYVVENSGLDEASYTYPSPELLNYVKVLRKIEREPAEAPLTSAAVRALERARKIRAKSLLEECRHKFSAIPVAAAERTSEFAENGGYMYAFNGSSNETSDSDQAQPSNERTENRANGGSSTTARPKPEKSDPFVDRQSISEVLHDIYDKNVQ